MAKLRDEGIIKKTSTSTGCSFEIPLDNGQMVPRKPPARLAKLTPKVKKTPEQKKLELEAKLKAAEERKKVSLIQKIKINIKKYFIESRVFGTRDKCHYVLLLAR